MSDPAEAELLEAMNALWSMTMEEQRSVVSYLSRPLTIEEIEQQRRFWRSDSSCEDASTNSL